MHFLLPLFLAVVSAPKALSYSGIWDSCYSPLYEQSGTSYTGITDNPNWWLSAFCYRDDGTVNQDAVIELGGCLSNNFGQLICMETNFDSYYGDSCVNCTGASTNPNTGNIVPYSCFCNNDEGADVFTEIDLNNCLGNQDGTIVC